MCDTGDILIGQYVAGQNITINNSARVDPVVLWTNAATQGWTVTATQTGSGQIKFLSVNAICLDFVP